MEFTQQDRKDFTTFEKTVDQWLDKTVEAGKALLEISERKLYLIAEHTTWDSYVKARYGKTRQWASDEINRAITLAQTGFDLPASVAQPLKGLDAKTRQAVVTSAAKNAKSEKRETPSRKDVVKAVSANSVAQKQKAETARKPNLKVLGSEPESRHRISIATTHRDEVLKVLEEFGDAHWDPRNKSLVVECDKVSSLLTHIGRFLDKLPTGTKYELSVHGEVVDPAKQKKPQQRQAPKLSKAM